MIDGTSNVDTSLGTPAAILSIDIIQEFKEQTATYSAEYGFSANQINIVSKSGTNDFHGSAFAFFRNEKLDARNFFDPVDAEKPKLDQKQPGFYVGGPVRLPFYDGRNKTFFLFNYEAAQDRAGLERLLHGALARRAVRPLHDDNHRSGDRTTVSQQHHPAGAMVAARQARRAVDPGAEHRTQRRATTR